MTYHLLLMIHKSPQALVFYRWIS